MTEPTADSVELRFKQIKKLTLEKSARIHRAVFFEISKRVIDKTPVDTGRARGGWHGDVNVFTPAEGEFKGSAAEASAHAMQSVTEAVAKHQIGQDLTLSNGVEYIRPLDQGHSKIQAPNGMTAEAINELSAVVEVTARSVK